MSSITLMPNLTFSASAITPLNTSTPGGPSNPDTDVDPASCSLLGPTALIVQASMGLFVSLSLLVKRQYEGTKKAPSSASGGFAREQGDNIEDDGDELQSEEEEVQRQGGPSRSHSRPGRRGRRRRTWKVWMLDVGKQLVGQGCLHGSNLLISDQVSSHGDGEINPCSLYFLNILVDTTIGVLVLYGCLKAITWLCMRFWDRKGFVSGEYGSPPKSSYFARQLLVYLLSIFIMKLSVTLLFSWLLQPILLPIAKWVLDWMAEWSQVVFVMAVFPLAMNVLQFCIIDSLIKGGNALHGEEEPSGSPRRDSHDIDDDPKDDHRAPLLSGAHDMDAEGETSSPRRPSSPSRLTVKSPGTMTALLSEPASPALTAGYGSTGATNSGSTTPATPFGPGPSGRTSSRGSGQHPSVQTRRSEISEADAIAAELHRITATEANFGQWVDGQHQSSKPIPKNPLTRPNSGSTHRSRLSDDMREQARRTLSADGRGNGDDRVREGSHPLKNR